MSDETYLTNKTSPSTMDFDPIVLPKGRPVQRELSRRVLLAQGLRNAREATEPLEVTLAYQKRHAKGACDEDQCWEGLQRWSPRSLPQGHEARIDLDSHQTMELARRLNDMLGIAGEGIVPGRHAHLVLREDDADFAEQVRVALEASDAKRAILASLLAEAAPALVEAQALRARHARRKSAVAEFEEHMMAHDWAEGEWEGFFRRNEWIFGHALAYQFLGEVQKQPVYEGADVTGKGAKRGDFLMATAASVRFTVLVEIKTPGAALVTERTYRNGVHELGKDLVGGVAQVQASCRLWPEESGRKANSDLLEDELGVYTVEPRGILVVGDTKGLRTRPMRETFESFRTNLHSPQVVTFDELLERARWLVEHELGDGRGEVDPATGEVDDR